MTLPRSSHAYANPNQCLAKSQSDYFKKLIVYFASSGTDFGTAITYDFPFRRTDNNLLITPFVGASIDVNTGGNSITTAGLTGGADFDLSDSLRLKAAVIIPLSSDRGQTTGVTLGAGFRF
jgi:hypothetical protein